MKRPPVAAHEIEELRDADRPDLMERLGMVQARGDVEREYLARGRQDVELPLGKLQQAVAGVSLLCYTAACLYVLFQIGRWLGGLLS